jgi:hypothetical protein
MKQAWLMSKKQGTYTANSIIGCSSSGKHNIRPEGASIAAGITSAAAGDVWQDILHIHTSSHK